MLRLKLMNVIDFDKLLVFDLVVFLSTPASAPGRVGVVPCRRLLHHRHVREERLHLVVEQAPPPRGAQGRAAEGHGPAIHSSLAATCLASSHNDQSFNGDDDDRPT